MRQIFVLIFTAVPFFTSLASGGEKARDWQTGTVLDSQRSRYFAGTVGNASTTGTAQTAGTYGTYQGHTNTSQSAVYRVYETFLIEGQTHAYLAQQRLRWRWSKPANLTVNGAVKFAVEKRKLFVIDDDGKQHEMEIIKQILRLPIAAILTSQGDDRLRQPIFILPLCGLVTLCAPRLIEQTAGSPFTESLFPSALNGDPPPLGT